MSFNKSILPILVFGLLLHSCGSDAPETSDLSEDTTKVEVATKTDNRQKAAAKVDSLINTTTLKEKEIAENIASSEKEKADEARAVKDKALEEKENEARRKRRAKRKAKREAAAKKAAEAKAVSVELGQGDVKPRSSGVPIAEFENKVYKYGKIEQGDKVEYKFKFKNTGKLELVVKDATATCGCTKPSYPFLPIGPGEEGYIGVVFDSKGKLGRQRPAVTVLTNGIPASHTLYLEGFVNSPKEKEEKN